MAALKKKSHAHEVMKNSIGVVNGRRCQAKAIPTVHILCIEKIPFLSDQKNGVKTNIDTDM
jgi:hypothetical protein